MSRLFNRVILVAQQMAGSVGATLVDDNQRPLGTAQIEKLDNNLKSFILQWLNVKLRLVEVLASDYLVKYVND